jgi:hypothetical protein
MSENRHLNNSECAIYAEYLSEGRTRHPEIVEQITEHLSECHQCRMLIMELYDLMPFFDIRNDSNGYHNGKVATCFYCRFSRWLRRRIGNLWLIKAFRR